MHYLKTDGDFVTGLAHNETDRLIVRSIAQLARGMGIETIAEFVGDDATLSLLGEYGVDMAQGHHIGHPADAGSLRPPRVR